MTIHKKLRLLKLTAIREMATARKLVAITDLGKQTMAEAWKAGLRPYFEGGYNTKDEIKRMFAKFKADMGSNDFYVRHSANSNRYIIYSNDE